MVTRCLAGLSGALCSFFILACDDQTRSKIDQPNVAAGTNPVPAPAVETAGSGILAQQQNVAEIFGEIDTGCTLFLKSHGAATSQAQTRHLPRTLS